MSTYKAREIVWDTIGLVEGPLGKLLRSSVRQVVIKRDCPTACVFEYTCERHTYVGLVVGPHFIKLCRRKPAEAIQILQHEAGHIARLDMARATNRIVMAWNLATDAVINEQLGIERIGKIDVITKESLRRQYGIQAIGGATNIYNELAKHQLQPRCARYIRSAQRIAASRGPYPEPRQADKNQENANASLDEDFRKYARKLFGGKKAVRRAGTQNVQRGEAWNGDTVGRRLYAALLRQLVRSRRPARAALERDWSMPGSAPYRPGSVRGTGGLVLAIDISGSLHQYTPVNLAAARRIAALGNLRCVVWADKAVSVRNHSSIEWARACRLAGGGTNACELFVLAKQQGWLDTPTVIVTDCFWGMWADEQKDKGITKQDLARARAAGWVALCAKEWADIDVREQINSVIKVVEF